MIKHIFTIANHYHFVNNCFIHVCCAFYNMRHINRGKMPFQNLHNFYNTHVQNCPFLHPTPVISAAHKNMPLSLFLLISAKYDQKRPDKPLKSPKNHIFRTYFRPKPTPKCAFLYLLSCSDFSFIFSIIFVHSLPFTSVKMM